MLPQICLPLDDGQCPLADQTLGEMYRANGHGIDHLVAAVPTETRALLALYCYRRVHLNSIGLTIAAECAKEDLVRWGGSAGAALFDRSRESAKARVVPMAVYGRRKISLGTCATGPMPPFEDDL